MEAEMKKFIFLLGITLILINYGQATTVVTNGKSVPVYKGKTPLAYKEYVPKSVRNQRALEEAGITIAPQPDPEMLEYLEKKKQAANEKGE
jgi:hypothetical protein